VGSKFPTNDKGESGQKNNTIPPTKAIIVQNRFSNSWNEWKNEFSAIKKAKMMDTRTIEQKAKYGAI